MTQETLNKAKALEQKIKEFKQALTCFEVEWNGEVISATPKLIIDFDDFDGGRDQVMIPMQLNKSLIDFLKEEIKNGLHQAETEFQNL